MFLIGIYRNKNINIISVWEIPIDIYSYRYIASYSYIETFKVLLFPFIILVSQPSLASYMKNQKFSLARSAKNYMIIAS